MTKLQELIYQITVIKQKKDFWKVYNELVCEFQIQISENNEELDTLENFILNYLIEWEHIDLNDIKSLNSDLYKKLNNSKHDEVKRFIKYLKNTLARK